MQNSPMSNIHTPPRRGYDFRHFYRLRQTVCSLPRVSPTAVCKKPIQDFGYETLGFSAGRLEGNYVEARED
jgi:hypothetical protein